MDVSSQCQGFRSNVATQTEKPDVACKDDRNVRSVID